MTIKNQPIRPFRKSNWLIIFLMVYINILHKEYTLILKNIKKKFFTYFHAFIIIFFSRRDG